MYQFTYNKKAKKKNLLSIIVGATGFEPATTWSQTRSATGLRYTPLYLILIFATAKVRINFLISI